MTFLRGVEAWFKSFAKYFRYIIAVVLLVMHFTVWHINMPELQALQSDWLQFATVMLLVGYVLTLHIVDPKEDLKSIGFILALLFVLIMNTTKLIIDLNGIEVDFGLRSETLFMDVFPSFILTILVFRHLSKCAFDIALGTIGMLFVGYASIVVYGFLNEQTTWFGFVIGSLDGRWQSILNNSNALGEYSFLGIFVIMYFLTIFKSYWSKLLVLLPAPIFLVSLILSGSRTALLLVITMIAVYIIYYFLHTKRNKIMILLFFVGMGIVLYLIRLGIFDQLLSLIRNESSLSGRDIIWKNSMQIIEEHLIHGIGYNNFTFVYNELFGAITSPHNMLIGVFAEYGVFGFILVIGWFVYLIIKNQNAIITMPEHVDKSRLIAFNMFYIAYFVGQMTEYAFLKTGGINTLFLGMAGFNMKVLYDMRYKPKKMRISIFIIAIFLVITYYLKLPQLVMMTVMMLGSTIITLTDFLISNIILKVKRLI
jgi:O-antigen ligase